MSLPWSEMMTLINLDNELNPTPSAIATQHKKTTSHRYNPYKKPTSSSNKSSSSSDLSALHQWIDNLMQSDTDVPEQDLFEAVPCKDATGKEIRMKNATGRNLIRPLRDYTGLFDPTQPLPEDPELSKGKGKKQWLWILQQLVDPSKREVVAWTGRGREFIILNDLAITELWSKFDGLAKPIDFESFRRTIRTHYQKDIMIPSDTKGRKKNRRFAFYTEPSIHVGMTREELTNYINTYNTNSPLSSAEKTIEEVPSHSHPTPAPSTESFFNFSAPSPTNSQFSHPPLSYPFNVNPRTVQAPEFSYPHPADPSHFNSPTTIEHTPEFPFPAPVYPTPSITLPPIELSQSPKPVTDQFISNIDQSESLPVLEINESDLQFDVSWNSPEDANAENGDWLDGLF
ncbi:hypothetical protein PRIPAC_74117 [Pristionchus pacificus]|nr:hypothetical protein PRIPAC_74117 [Pristionchus pacificus]